MADDRNTDARKAALAAGQTLEKRGLVDGAVEAYRSVGAVEDAARVLMGARRYVEAGNVLFEPLQANPEDVARLEAPARKQAMQAAVCYARGNETDFAARIFLALGEKERAADLYRRAGDHVKAATILGQNAKGPGTVPPVAPQQPKQQVTAQNALQLENAGRYDLALDAYVQLRDGAGAGRMAMKLGRPVQAGELYGAANFPFEAAAAFFQGRDFLRSLEWAQRVPRDDPKYRQAAMLAIRVASEIDRLDFALENFLTKFTSAPPQGERETESFVALARLYRRHDFPENALDAFRKVLAANPTHALARAQVEELDKEARGSAMVFRQIVEEDAAFHGRPGARPQPVAPALPDLPDLPGLPTLAGTPSADAWADASAPDPFLPEAGTIATVPTRMKTPTSPPRPMAPPIPQATPIPTATPVTPRPMMGAPVAPRPPTLTPRPPAPTVPPAAPPAVTVPPPAVTVPPPSATVPPAGTKPLVLEPGVVLADRYRLERKIGQGGMASVFRAHDLELDETIAIKVFTKLVEDAQMIARFKQELSLSRQLQHPNIIRLYDIGSVQGFKYITMELLAGADLKSRLGRPLDLATGLDFLAQAATALGHAHDKGIVHRDIKPANLFLTIDGTVKLMDFGIAKRTATPGLTVAGMIAGTPEYMSPEQINGFEKVTASTDLYALGIMAYEFFTGAVPFRHPEIMPLLLMQLREPPPPPRTKNPQLPVEVEKVVLKLLEKDPAARYQSCAELVAALRPLQERAKAK